MAALVQAVTGQRVDLASVDQGDTSEASAAAAGKPCGVCGEMGGDPRATALLLGLGVTELSMGAGSLGYVKREVRRTPLAAARHSPPRVSWPTQR